jgi:hypothetical protein
MQLSLLDPRRCGVYFPFIELIAPDGANFA